VNNDPIIEGIFCNRPNTREKLKRKFAEIQQVSEDLGYTIPELETDVLSQGIYYKITGDLQVSQSVNLNWYDNSDNVTPAEQPYDLTEEDELIAQYGRANLNFVQAQDWVSDDLEHYFGKF